MRIVALINVYNEARFLAACVEHYHAHGVEVYVIDNESTDRTVEIAHDYRGRGVAGVRTVPRDGTFHLAALLEHKIEAARRLDADWYIHADCDEIRLPPYAGTTLAEALAEADREGYNAVNFFEYTFLPTEEAPDHEHPDFLKTMRWYYPFAPWYPHRVNAWKAQPAAIRVDLAWSGGHRVRFPGQRLYPVDFKMRHYLCLSLSHAVEKYGRRVHNPEGKRRGWHRQRIGTGPEDLRLPAQEELRPYLSDDALDNTNPRTSHLLLPPPPEPHGSPISSSPFGAQAGGVQPARERSGS